jgi:UDP-GlcNAc:undecaprenyl-phosphate/decaprenyl-phosphate GlcNAc-1-phosphate transferase
VTFALTPLVRRASMRLGLVDQPGERKVHSASDPAWEAWPFSGGSLPQLLCSGRFSDTPRGPRYSISASGPVLGDRGRDALIFSVGFLDDVRRSGRPKLIGQLLAAGIVVACGVRIDFIGNPFGGGFDHARSAEYPGHSRLHRRFANVINLIDGLDGLAAGVTAIAAVTFLLLAVAGQPV